MMKAKIICKNIIRCKKCGDIIESKHVHDFVSCSCGVCAVDGGHDYLRRCGNSENYEDLSEYKEIEVTPKYKVGEVVTFQYIFSIIKGTIQVADTYPNSTIIEYDILDEQEPRLYRHISERNIVES